MSPAVLLVLAQAPDAAAMIAAARAQVAGPHCVYDQASPDVTVCGLRRADRYRVPFVTRDPGDPRYEAVAAERARLLHRTTPIQELSPFLVGGGMVGAHMTVSGSGAVHAEGLRQLAP